MTQTQTLEVQPQGTPPAEQALAALLSDQEKLKECPIETVERVFALYKEFEDRRARAAWNEAFLTVQGKLQAVAKKGWNPHTKSHYARAEEVFDMLNPLLIEHGFSRSFSSTDSPIQDHVRWVMRLRHGSHEEQFFMDAPSDHLGPKGNPVKTRLHGMASSGTYCERHLAVKVFGVQIIGDDDGNGGAGVGPSAERITENQYQDLLSFMQEVGADRGRFLRHFEIDKIEYLPKSRLAEAISLCEKKRNRG